METIHTHTLTCGIVFKKADSVQIQIPEKPLISYIILNKYSPSLKFNIIISKWAYY